MDGTSVLPIRSIINMFTTESKHCIFNYKYNIINIIIHTEHEKALKLI